MSVIGSIYYGIKNRLAKRAMNTYVQDLINDLLRIYSENEDPEIKEVCDYYKKGGKSVFPYNIEEAFDYKKTKVYFDEHIDLHYVLHNSKKLYFPRNFSIGRIKKLYGGLVIEQYEKSPHRYTNNDFSVHDGDILIDVGCADALFSLDQIEKVKSLILFENQDYWIEALHATFKPWENKVVIVNKFVDDHIDDNSTTLDHYLSGRILDEGCFIKIDVEGNELKVLYGAASFLKRASMVKIAIAS
ncbi:MAG: FkbM family methyltransferase, partial [Bacteroidota bacterium]